MAGATIRVTGARELTAAFREVDRKLATRFGAELKSAAQPVVSSAQAKVTRYAGASVGTIRARRSGATVYVEQSARKVTGQRPDFGALQMVNVLMPALDERTGEVITDVERVIDKYANEAGF